MTAKHKSRSGACGPGSGAALPSEGGAPLSRRALLRGGVWGAAGWLLADGLMRRAFAAEPGAAAPAAAAPATAAAAAAAPATPAKAKAVIQIWLSGGPPHTDTFDPKPKSGRDYTGPFDSPIPTNVEGIQIGQMLPLLAQQADKYALIRSMTHGNNGHETAAYMVQTGRRAEGTDVFPCVGSVVSFFKGYAAGYSGLLPPYIVLTRPEGRFSEAGFLGPRYKPFATGGDPAAPQFVVEGFVAEGITRERQKARRGLLHDLDALGSAMAGDPRLEAQAKAEETAYDLILGEASNIFYLDTEPVEVRQAYGLNTFGQSCLMARRLVEKGIPYVQINSGGWDTHKQHFEAMRQKLPQLDNGLATLLKELADRRLLESTVIWCCGEFGRTPKVDVDPPWAGGRGHYGAVFSCLVAGGGFKGGRVVGASDAKGEKVAERPVYPWDLIGSIYELLGMDPEGTFPNYREGTVRLTPAAAEGYPIGGRLKEIM